jgi:hypothetical protein
VIRSLRPMKGLALLAFLLVAVAAACGSTAAGPRDTPTGPTAVEAPLPSGLGTRYDVQLDGPVCPSAGNCAVSGMAFTRGALGEHAYLLVEKAGSWSVVPVPLPRALPAGTKEAVRLASLSCPATGHCVGVGAAHSGTRVLAIRMTQHGGRWAETAFKLPAGDANGGPAAISCAAVGSCSVVGGDSDVKGRHQHLLFLAEKNGRWGGWRSVSLPRSALAVSPAGGNLISCPGRGDCTATGSYENHAYDTVGLLMTERRGMWRRPVQPALPSSANVGQNPLIGLAALSCPSAGNCTLVGGYFDSQRNESGLILDERDGEWRRGSQAPLPSNAGPNPQHGDAPEVPLRSVSCASSRDCAAVGSYRDKGDNMHVLLLSEKAGKWTPSEPEYPADAVGGVDPGGLSAVACTSPGNCVAAGGYVTGTNQDGTYRGKPLLVYERQGAWQQGVGPALPADAAVTGGAGLTSVVCPPAGSCLAIGSYTDEAGNQQGLLVTLPRP